MLKFFKKYYPNLLLLVLVGVIFYTNYVPNTFLIGWDGLHTELNSWLGVKRAFFSVWEEYQSFGLTSGMAHASDLMRALFVWFLSLFLSLGPIRYIFHHLMLLVGGLGVFYLIKFLFKGEEDTKFAFIGAVFYVLNFGTTQIFGVPFEPFSVFFAFLPWEILAFLRYLEFKEKKNVIFLVLINFLATPQAYIQTLFVVYLVVLLFFSVGFLVKNFSREKVKKVLSAIGFVLLVNSFWILPQMYFLKTSLNVVGSSKINQIATETTFYRNLEKGKFRYFTRFEGFYYDLFDVDGNELFGAWKTHFENKFVFYLSFVPFVFVVLGLTIGKIKYKPGFVFTFIFLAFVFLSGTVPFSFVHEAFKKIPLLGQIFRSPFTKFIVPYSLISSVLFVLGLSSFLDLIVDPGFFLSKFIKRIYCLVFLIVIVVISFPVFRGELFLSQMKVSIPESYFEVFDYFSNQDRNKRIALFPDYTYWGWFKTNWGYDGSGFLWYGVEQPIISRTFDVWSNESESYFWEIKAAIESQNVENFEKVLEKYVVKYLIIDYTLEPVAAQKAGLQYDQVSQIVSESKKLSLLKSLNGISIFGFDGKSEGVSISLANNLPVVGPLVEVTDYDSAFYDLGVYVSEKSPDYHYPFLDLVTQAGVYKKTWSLYESEENFVLESKLPFDPSLYELEVIGSSDRARVFDGSEIKYFDLGVQNEISDSVIKTRVKKELISSADLTKTKIENCFNKKDSLSLDVGLIGITIRSSDGAAGCFGYGRPLLALWNGYLLKVESENIKGRPLFFYTVAGKSRDQSKVEKFLDKPIDYFILKPGYYYDDGYGFGFQNLSYQGVESENRLKGLSIYLFPYDVVKGIRFVKKETVKNVTDFKSVEFEKSNYSTYRIKGNTSDFNTVVLYQAYDPGWLAFCGVKPCRVEHVEVNNWANGWVFEGNVPENVKLVFWPQYLQYLGYILFVAAVFVVLMKKNRSMKASEIAKPHSIDRN